MTNPLLVIPGFMGSQLARVTDHQRVWVDPTWAVTHVNEFLDNLALKTTTDDRLKPDGILHDVNIGDIVRIGIYRDLHEFCVSPAGLGLPPTDYHEVAYDWRKTLSEAAQQVATALVAIPNPPVNVIAHSQAGLVVSALYRDAPSAAARIGKIFALGCPFAGLLKTIAMLQGGSGILTNFFPEDPIRSLLIGMPGTYEMLPSPHNPGLIRDAAGNTVSPFDHPDWFPPAVFDPSLLSAAADSLAILSAEFEVPLRIIEGYGVSTGTYAQWNGTNLEVQSTEDGDGTCPARSLLSATGTGGGSTLAIRWLSIPFGEHVELVRRREFFTFLRADLIPGSPQPQQVLACVRRPMLPLGTENLLIVETRTPDGKPLATGVPIVSTTNSMTIPLLPCATAPDARWLAHFPQPPGAQRVRVQVPGIPPASQPRPFVIVGT